MDGCWSHNSDSRLEEYSQRGGPDIHSAYALVHRNSRTKLSSKRIDGHTQQSDTFGFRQFAQ